MTTLYAECDGRPLRGPNDIVFDHDGGFWFSDLGKSNAEWMHHGHLLKFDGKSWRLKEAAARVATRATAG